MKSNIVMSLLLIAISFQTSAQDLLVAKTCPVVYNNTNIGILAFSMPWYHNGGSQASYIAKDNATGIGIEIHFLANKNGFSDTKQQKICDQFRIMQFRNTNAKLPRGEDKVQLDIPATHPEPFYDAPPLEFGHGMHQTPIDHHDKPWKNIIMRASTVAIYDTPFVSDSYGIEGKDIIVKFETCVVCRHFKKADHILSCGSWGFNREYMGGMTAWSEPEADPIKCSDAPNKEHLEVLNNSNLVSYKQGIDWQ